MSVESEMHSDQTKVLSMNISCCEQCPEILKKKILKMPGVDSIDIDMENNLVLVTGIVDAMTLLNKVAKLGKSVHLLPNGEHHSNNNNHIKRKQKDTRYRDSDKDFTHRQKEKKQEEHKCEAYEPPPVDERVCRDFYCKVHPRSRAIVDTVPRDGSSSLFGAPPFYGGGGFGPYSAGSYVYPQPPLFGYDRQPPQFGYHRAPPRMLPHPFGFH